MYTPLVIALFASAKAVFAACSGPLVIDDFSKWSSNSNSLNDWVSGTLKVYHLMLLIFDSPRLLLLTD